jgi:hypothetical protein
MTLHDRLLWYVHRAQNIAEKPLRRLGTVWARRQLAPRGLLALLTNRPATAYPPDVVDLWFLYRQVRARKSRCVLEFGAGCSTVILAQALADNRNGGRLYSVDTVPYWAETTWARMPPHLQTLATVTSSELASVTIGGDRVLRHVQLPNVTPDFVYVDGPDFQDFSHLADVPAACDVLDLEPNLPSNVYIVIDGRARNTQFLKDHLRGRYCQRRNWPHEYWRTHVLERQA